MSMSLNNKPLTELTEQDLRELIDNAVPEGRTIDYKLELKCLQDVEKKEFLADISSFANTLGGHLVIGMDEVDAVPTDLKGIPSTNTDQLILQAENIIRDGLDPRVIGIHSHVVQLQNGNVAIVIRVPKSFTAPHQVSFKNSSRFYARNSRGKYQLDAGEIRQAFLLSDSLTKQIEEFRLNRLASLGANETLYPMLEGGKIILHIIPVSSFTSQSAVDLRQINDVQDLWSNLLPMASSGWDRRYNLEGWLMHSVLKDGILAGAYTQVFRNGTVESVEGQLIDGNSSGAFWEQNVVDALGGVMKFFQRANIQTPFVLMLSYLGVAECEAGSRNSMRRADRAHPVERDNVICDPIWVNEPGKSAAELLLPAFDLAWNACGWPRYPYAAKL
jgi:hypothetical protein